MLRRVLLGACLIASHAAVAAEGGCEHSHSLATGRYVDALSSNPRDTANAIFRAVPSDLTVLPESAAYVARGDVALHRLPLENSPSGGGLRNGEQFTPACRVTGTTGDAWLVIKSPDAALLYLPENRAAKASASDAGAAAAEPEKRSRDPLFQGKY